MHAGYETAERAGDRVSRQGGRPRPVTRRSILCGAGPDRLRPWPGACTSQPSKGSPASPRWPSGSSRSSPSGSSGSRSFAPSCASEAATDYVLDLLVSHDAVALSYDECAGVTYSELHRDPDAALDRIVERYHLVAEKADAVVVVGSDYTDVGAPTEFSFNARVAANLGTPVLLVAQRARQDRRRSSHDHGRGGGGGARGQPRLAVRDRGQPRGPGRPRRGARRARRATTYQRSRCPSEPLLSAPSVGDMMAGLRGHAGQRRGAPAGAGGHRPRRRRDDAAQRAGPAVRRCRRRGRRATAPRWSSASSPPMCPRTSRRCPGSSSTAASRWLPRSAASSRACGPRCRSSRPTSAPRTPRPRSPTLRGRLHKDSPRKVATALALFDEYVDGDALLDRLEVARSDAVTPLMFEHQLLDLAVADRRHIVLPEGDDDRDPPGRRHRAAPQDRGPHHPGGPPRHPGAGGDARRRPRPGRACSARSTPSCASGSPRSTTRGAGTRGSTSSARETSSWTCPTSAR